MDDRVVVITGASSGIGAAVAHRLAGRCTGMVLHARKSAESLERVAAEVSHADLRIVTALGDLAEPGVAENIIDTATREFGRLDGLVANAGFPILKPFEEGTLEDVEYSFRGNVFSFFALVRRALDMLKASTMGRVVALGSFTSHVFRPDVYQFPLSASSKGAVETAVRSLSVMLGESGVTVNCVVPGFIRKDQGTKDSVSEEELEKARRCIPLQRLGTSDDVAAAVEFLLSDGASYITGQAIHVNGGLI